MTIIAAIAIAAVITFAGFGLGAMLRFFMTNRRERDE